MPGIDASGKDTIRARQADPSDFDQKSFRTIVLDKAKGVKAVIGKRKGEKNTSTQSILFPKENFTVAQAKKWLKDNKMKTEEKSRSEFLDPVRKLWPLSYPAIFETLIDFNNGALYESGYYGWDQVSTYGRKLARKLNVNTNVSMSDEEYDDDGRPTISAYQSNGNKQTMYKFHDGQVIVVRSRGSNDDEMEWEYTEDSGESEPNMTFSGEEDIDIIEAEYPGQVVKSLRNKKKMSRDQMSAKMNISAARLKEIEDGDDIDDDEMSEISGALGMTKKKMKKVMDAMTADISPDSDDISQEEIEIEDVEIEDFDTVQVYELLEEIIINNKPAVKYKLSGELLLEERRNDGTVGFTVPMIKVGAYTANGNRYSLKCCENIIQDIKKLQESQSRRDGEAADRLSILHINSPKTKKSETMTTENSETPTMLPTHGARISEALGNPLLSISGIVTGAHFNNDQSILYIDGETIPTQAGKDMTVLLEKKLVKGVSLAGTPAKGMYEKNDKGAYDVDRLHFFGSDFTNNPAMPFEADEAGFKLAA